MKIEALIKCQPEETKMVEKNSPFVCLIPSSLMDPVRDRKSGKLVDPPEAQPVKVSNQVIWLSPGQVKWEEEKGKEYLVFKVGTPPSIVVARRYLRANDYYRMFVPADPANMHGKIYPANLRVKL